MTVHQSAYVGSITHPPFYPALVAFAAACFVGTLATDVAYWRTADILWVDFSDWLVTIGVIVGCLALIVALIELLAFRSRLARRPTWMYAIGNIGALVLGAFDMLMHTRDAWTAVVPGGLVLSAATVLVLLVTAWMAPESLYRAGTEVTA